MPETPARDALARAAGALTPARKVGELLDDHRAEVLRDGLTDAERAMLRYAMDLVDAGRTHPWTDEERASIDSLKRLAGEDVTPDYTEARGYQVVGDWGVDYAEDEDHARRQVAQALSAYPSCGARAEWRIERTWDDGAEYTGPWIPLT